ncbi:hypothetical protein HWV62_39287 [Athelia sp. TMB]|nr:hypothetical protein HWV62_39287 [Athelia sp. TMB]
MVLGRNRPSLPALGAHLESRSSLKVRPQGSIRGPLSATFLRNRIMGTLRSFSDPQVSDAVASITQNVVFAHLTIRQLAFHLTSLVSGNALGEESRTTIIEKMIEKYSADLIPMSTPHKSHSVPSATSVVTLITGTTGALGSYMLEALLKDARVRHVYAYNRAARGVGTIHDRQVDAFEDKGLDVTLLESSKLIYLEGDSASPNLGLSDALYEELKASLTLIIHNAWRLDFNLSLPSFEPNIRGTRNLIDLALQSRHASGIRFMFTSSVASSLGWDQTKGDFPEEVQMDVSTAVGSGYGEGKYVSERILDKSGLQASSFRIGQISGGLPNGAWATSDWVPSFVKSSLTLGALPDARGVVAWLPMHTVSQAILDVAFAEERPPMALNIVHPRPSSWSYIVQSISDALQHEGVIEEPLPLVPFTEWFDRLEQRSKGADEQEMSRVPAIKLLEWFRGLSSADALLRQSDCKNIEAGGLVTLSTTKSQMAGSTMAMVRAIGAEDASRWVTYWLFKRFI